MTQARNKIPKGQNPPACPLEPEMNVIYFFVANAKSASIFSYQMYSRGASNNVA